MSQRSDARRSRGARGPALALNFAKLGVVCAFFCAFSVWLARSLSLGSAKSSDFLWTFGAAALVELAFGALAWGIACAVSRPPSVDREERGEGEALARKEREELDKSAGRVKLAVAAKKQRL